jgi:SulP family sulfate permease
VLRIHGPFLFGATEKLSEATFNVDSLPPVVILRLRNMTAIDATGLHELEKLTERLRAKGKTLLMCGARSQPQQLLRQSAFLRYLGEENMLPHVEAALSRAREVYEGRARDPLVTKVV